MASEPPQLNDKALPWYRGLSRYQWWVLIIATLGWLFDTMDQQFFTLGRGPAMKEILGVSPLDAGLERIGDAVLSEYRRDDLEKLVDQGLLQPRDIPNLLRDDDGQPTDTATRGNVAVAVGEHLLTPKYIEYGTPLLPESLGYLTVASHMGRQALTEKEIEGEQFGLKDLQSLGEKGQITLEVVARLVEKERLDTQEGKSRTITREDLAVYVGKPLVDARQNWTKQEVDSLVAEGVEFNLESSADGTPLTAERLERAIGQRSIADRSSISRDALHKLVQLDVITPEAAEQLLGWSSNATATSPAATLPATPSGDTSAEIGDPPGVPQENLIRYFGKQKAEKMASDEGNFATSVFIFGWAFGGLFFGWVGDTLGRAKTMALAILTYAVFTGLNGLAQDPTQFHILRFLTAMGVGGEFAAGAALVAETMPERSRAAALGALQALSSIGNMTGAVLAFFIMPLFGWRWLFAIGALPALLVVVIRLTLKEPDRWVNARKKWLEQKAAGTTDSHSGYLGLFTDGRWARRAVLGMLLGVVGVGGLWGVGFFTPELNRLIARNYSEEATERFVAAAFFLQQVGAFLGITAYTWISLRMGRKPAFGIFFILAFFVVSYTFLYADSIGEAYVLGVLVGFVTLGPFGGYAIYFPELFPTRLRATGVGFCYNVGRFLAALVPQFKSGLQGLLMSGALVIPFLPAVAGSAERAIRYGSFLMIFIYIFGLFVLLLAPETKDQPLPED